MTDSPNKGAAAEAPTIRRAVSADRGTLSQALARAFDDDPVWGWLFPDESSRQRRSAQVFRAYLLSALSSGEVYTTPDLSGASLWKPR